MNDAPKDGPLFFTLVVLGFAICAMAATAAFQSAKKEERDWRAECLSKGGAVVARTRLGPKNLTYTDYVCEVKP